MAPFGGRFNVLFFGLENFEWSMQSITVGGVLLIGALLCCLIGCLLLAVVTLTFDCWWTLGTFFNLDENNEGGTIEQNGKSKGRREGRGGGGKEKRGGRGGMRANGRGGRMCCGGGGQQNVANFGDDDFDEGAPMMVVLQNGQHQHWAAGKSAAAPQNGAIPICIQRMALDDALEALTALV